MVRSGIRVQQPSRVARDGTYVAADSLLPDGEVLKLVQSVELVGLEWGSVGPFTLMVMVRGPWRRSGVPGVGRVDER